MQVLFYGLNKLGVFMDRVNGFVAYLLGLNLGILRDHFYMKEEYTFGDLAKESLALIQNLEQFADDKLDLLPLSKRAAKMIAANIRAFGTPEYLQKHVGDRIGLTEKNTLIFSLNHLENLLMAELASCDLYFISQKRAYNMGKLIFSAEEHLGKSVIQFLSEQCINEIREAGRCIAFDLPTASAFHMFRAIETVVLMYFPLLEVVLQDSDKNLGNYIRILETKGIEAKITGMLRHLKDTYRNPIIHPELKLEEDEAQNLFSFALSAISAMANDITTLKQKPLPLPIGPTPNLLSQSNP